MTSARAMVHWLSRDEGGRKSPPFGGPYSAIVEFDNSSSDNNESAWSLVLELGHLCKSAIDSIVNVHFLSPEAPVELLEPGNRFILKEGRRVVAKGEIISVQLN